MEWSTVLASVYYCVNKSEQTNKQTSGFISMTEGGQGEPVFLGLVFWTLELNVKSDLSWPIFPQHLVMYYMKLKKATVCGIFSRRLPGKKLLPSHPDARYIIRFQWKPNPLMWFRNLQYMQVTKDACQLSALADFPAGLFEFVNFGFVMKHWQIQIQNHENTSQLRRGQSTGCCQRLKLCAPGCCPLLTTFLPSTCLLPSRPRPFLPLDNPGLPASQVGVLL